MKHPLHYLRQIFFFLLILAVCSCEKEEVTETSVNSNGHGFQYEEKSLEDFIADDKSFVTAYKQVISKEEEMAAKGKSHDFTINPNKVVKIENEGRVTYTMSIEKQDEAIGAYNNLVIEVEENKPAQAYILTYKPDEGGLKSMDEHDSFSFKGTVTGFPIQYDTTDLVNSRQILVITVTYCNYGGSEHLAGGNCTPSYMYSISYVLSARGGGGIHVEEHQDPPNPGFGGGGGGGGGVPTLPVFDEDEDPFIKRDAVITALESIGLQKFWLENNLIQTVKIFDFLAEDHFSDESIDFAKKAVLIMSVSNKLNNPSTPGYLDPLRVYIGEEVTDPYLMHYFSMQCAMIRLNFTPAEEEWCVSNPVACNVKVYWAALSEMIHLGLDIVGLVPVIGEGADLINGAIYLVEGDTVNASLSLAATVPFVGWTATGSKLVVKVVTNTAGEKALKIIAEGADEIAALASKLKHFTAQVDNAINSLKSGARYVLDGTGAHRQVAGHHPLAKKAFEGDTAYDLKEAFSVAHSKLKEFDVPHSSITGKQNALYTAWKNANPNKTMSINDMANIEVEAMVQAGVPGDVAKGWVVKALEDLKNQGVSEIKNIPWNGVN